MHHLRRDHALHGLRPRHRAVRHQPGGGFLRAHGAVFQRILRPALRHGGGAIRRGRRARATGLDGLGIVGPLGVIDFTPAGFLRGAPMKTALARPAPEGMPPQHRQKRVWHAVGHRPAHVLATAPWTPDCVIENRVWHPRYGELTRTARTVSRSRGSPNLSPASEASMARNKPVSTPPAPTSMKHPMPTPARWRMD